MSMLKSIPDLHIRILVHRVDVHPQSASKQNWILMNLMKLLVKMHFNSKSISNKCYSIFKSLCYISISDNLPVVKLSALTYSHGDQDHLIFRRQSQYFPKQALSNEIEPELARIYLPRSFPQCQSVNTRIRPCNTFFLFHKWVGKVKLIFMNINVNIWPMSWPFLQAWLTSLCSSGPDLDEVCILWNKRKRQERHHWASLLKVCDSRVSIQPKQDKSIL